MINNFQKNIVKWKLDQLLRSQNGLSLKPKKGSAVVVVGEFEFEAEYDDFDKIHDSYQLEIQIQDDFPVSVPTVIETEGRIPKSFHTQPDGTLCLGTSLRLEQILINQPDILAFVEECVIPYLYGYSYFEKHKKVPHGELDHGKKGVIKDYCNLFGIKDEKQCLRFIELASLQKKHANKCACFCGSGIRLGKCNNHNKTVNLFRSRFKRSRFVQEVKDLKKMK